MIRRDADSDFLLITQHDHALLSGELTRHVGNAQFVPPSPFNETVQAIAHHDAGWPLHDDHPTLNGDDLPLHVFEVPPLLAVRVWNASVDRARQLGPYQGLLVSLHVMGLSAFAISRLSPGKWTRPETFEVNKFQHRQVEVQEELRRELGMRDDVPLHLGLAQPGTSPADDQLLFNFRLLTAMDRISLSLCCGQPLFPTMDDILPRPGERPTRIQVTMPDPSTLALSPTLFDKDDLTFEVSARRVPRAYRSENDFRETYGRQPVESLRLRVIRS